MDTLHIYSTNMPSLQNNPKWLETIVFKHRYVCTYVIMILQIKKLNY